MNPHLRIYSAPEVAPPPPSDGSAARPLPAPATCRRRNRTADHTNAEVIAAYLSSLRTRLKGNDVSTHHLVASERDLERFAEFRPEDADLPMGQLRMSESFQADLDAFLLNPNWGNATRKRVRGEILACFNWAASDGGLILHSPYRRSKRLKLPVEPRREASPAEYVMLMRKGSRPLKRALMFIARSARTCEMREAMWIDVDWQARCVELFENKTKRVTGKSRLIGLDPILYRVLRRMHERARDQSGFIFRNTHGKQWQVNAFCQHLRKTLQRHKMDPGRGKRVTAYMFRHSWAGNAEENGCTDREIADGLGHSGTQLVHYYSKARKRKANQVRIAEKAARRKAKDI